MAELWEPAKGKKASDPLAPPKTILGEAQYRGRRIVCTDDPNYCASNIDGWGFKPPCVYVVLDEFDEVVFPIGMAAFFTPNDAANAIMLLDTVMPRIKAQQPATSLLFEYGLFRAYWRDFFNVYGSIKKIENKIAEAQAFGDDPLPAIRDELRLMHVNARNSRGIHNDESRK